MSTKEHQPYRPLLLFHSLSDPSIRPPGSNSLEVSKFENDYVSSSVKIVRLRRE